jgi:hypothetical protein
MLRITSGKGFQLCFENGLEISVQFGYGNYCDNHYNPYATSDGNTSCKDAEVAIISKVGEFITDEFISCGDSVVGYLNADAVADLITKVKNFKED